MPVVMSPNPKVVKKYIYGNGQVFEGGIDEALGFAGVQLAGPRNTEGVRAKKETDKTPKKICLECSSPAAEGSNYCSFCKNYI